MPTALNPTGAPSIFAGIGRLEYAPTNGPDDPFPTYVDLTPYLRTEDTPVRITRGRQTELDTVQPSQLTCVLDNTDNRFTFGNTGGAYGANWAPAKQIRYSETVGGRTFVLFKGYIEFPDIDDWQPIGYQEVRLTCTDRLTRLGRGRPFISTLAEHIRYVGGTALKAYYPLGEVAGPSYRPAVTTSASYPNLLEQVNLVSNAATSAGLNAYAAGIGHPVANDDLRQPSFSPQVAIISGSTYSALAGTILTSFVSGVTFGPGTVLTVACWVSPDPTRSVDGRWEPLQLGIGTGLGGGLIRIRRTDSTESPPNVWKASFIDTIGAAWSFEAYGIHSGSKPTLLAVRIDPGGNTMTLYVDGVAYAATPTGTLPSTMFLTSITVGTGPFIGTIGHVQIYESTGSTLYAVGPQRDAAWTALEYQTTGQRINTILDYAGVPSTDRAVDPGQSFMQRATLAGQDPQTALQDAVTTERGRGFAAGDGRYVFHDRIRTLNV